MPLIACNCASHAPYFYVPPRQRTAIRSFHTAASSVYSICLSFGSLMRSQVSERSPWLKATGLQALTLFCMWRVLFRASSSAASARTTFKDEREFAPEVYPKCLVHLCNGNHRRRKADSG